MKFFSSYNKYWFGITIFNLTLFLSVQSVHSFPIKYDLICISNTVKSKEINIINCNSIQDLNTIITISQIHKSNFDAKYFTGKNYFSLHSLLNDTCPTGHETDIWFMGSNGIDWGTDTPKVITGFNVSTWDVDQIGYTSICDRNGKLLLYTDNRTIYNGSHQPITNIIGKATSSMTLILPQPGQDSIYYVFHPDAPLDYLTELSPHSLFFTIINVRGNNNAGSVVKKNQVLLDGSSEKITGIKHCNGHDWWILGLRSEDEAFHTWLLTDTGLVNNNPIISFSGNLHNDALYSKYQNSGYLMPSHNGALLAEITETYRRPGYLELHKFNPSTGIVSDGIEILNNSDGFESYATGFSPDNSKLYLPCYDSNIKYNVYQFDVSLLDSTLIKNSMTQIYFGGRINIGAPILGKDGKLYITSWHTTNNLHVIYQPNKKGRLCDFRSFDYDLGIESVLGAPLFPAGLQFPYLLSIQGLDSFCSDTTVRFLLSDPCSHPNTEWNLPDGGEIKNINGDTIDVYFQYQGNKRLIAAYPTPCGYKSDTLNIEVKPCDVTSLNLSSTDLTSNLYPNPTSNSVTFVFSKINLKDVRFYLVDILNRVIIDKSIRIEEGKYQDTFDGLKPGVYFYSFSIRNKMLTNGKLIKI